MKSRKPETTAKAIDTRPKLKQLPMMVAIPLLIGILVLTSGLLNINILRATLPEELPDIQKSQIESSLRILENITYILAALSSVAGLLLALIIVRPIRRLSSALEDLREGKAEWLDFTRTGSEIGELGESFNRLMEFISQSMPERTRYLFDNMASGLLAFDGEGNVTLLNSSARRILELSDGDFLKKNYQFILSKNGNFKELVEILEEAEIGGIDHSAKRIQITTSSGRRADLAVTTTTMHDSLSKAQETIATLTDLTRAREINEQIQQSDKLSSLGTLAAGVAHEIRNPLASLRGLTQLLGEDLTPEDPKSRYIQVILEEVDRLNGVVQQLLDFSAVSKEEIHKSNMNNLIERSIQLAQPAFHKKKEIQLIRHLSPDIPDIPVFPRRIVQAILNLLLNALDAVNPEGNITISTSIEKNQLVISINNTGSYIEPEQQARIFDPFFTTKDRGTGLGLSITHQIARQHQGLLRVESSQDGGTTFQILLPMQGKVASVTKEV